MQTTWLALERPEPEEGSARDSRPVVGSPASDDGIGTALRPPDARRFRSRPIRDVVPTPLDAAPAYGAPVTVSCLPLA